MAVLATELSRGSRGRIAVAATLLLFGVVASGCVQQPGVDETPRPLTPSALEARRLTEMSLDLWEARTVRLQRISQRLRVAGRDVCVGAVAPVLRAAVQDISALPDALGDVARDRYGTDEGLVVLESFEAAPEGTDGLRSGDIIVALGGRATDAIPDLNRSLGSPVRIDLRRGGEPLTIEMDLAQGCRFPALLMRQDYVNAFADGEATRATTALMREFKDDTLLAMIIGHEMAHNLLGDVRARKGISGPRRESRADHVGIYLAVLGGFEVPESFDLYIQLQSDLDLIEKRNRSHPATVTRAARYRKTVQQIQEKREAGEPLLPEPE